MIEGIGRDILRLKITLGVVMILCFSALSIALVLVFAIYTQNTLTKIPIDDGDGSHAHKEGAEVKGEPLEEEIVIVKERESTEAEDTVIGGEPLGPLDSGVYFGDIDIEARSAMVWDVREGRALFEMNVKESLPLASLTKIMTAVVALEEAHPDFQVRISYESLQQHGNSGLFLEERWYLEDLAKMSMMTSANDASHAIASSVGLSINSSSETNAKDAFVSRMNSKCKEIGLLSTFFNNSTGLDINERTAGAYGSASDIVNLTLYTLSEHPSILYSTRYPVMDRVSISDFRHTFVNSNPVISEMEGVLASKTGYTDLAGGNLVIVMNADLNYPVIIVVMGSTFDGRFNDVKVLAEETRKYLYSS